KDLYVNYIKPDASNSSVKKLSFWITAIVGILVFIMAINPPDLLIWLNLFAFGGLEAAFIWPIIMGLYWKTGNRYGALSSIIIGVVSYICFNTFIPNPFGVHPVITPVVLSFFAFVIGSLLTKEREAN